MRFRRIFAAVLLICTLAAVLPVRAGAASKVYYNIDFSAEVAKTTVMQQVDKDCGVVSMATVEAYMHGATSAADRKIVYDTVIKVNNNSYKNYANWGNVGFVKQNIDWEKVYQQLEAGYPCIIHRTGGDGHYSVVAGYKGSTSKLEPDKFVVVNVYHASNPYPTVNNSVSPVGSWRQGGKVDTMVYRKNGTAITGLSGIRMAINVPKFVHTYGEGHGVYGQISSNKNLTSVLLQIVNARTGETVYNISRTPNAKSYNLFRLDESLKFKELPKGEYYYTVSAKNADGVTKFVKRYFVVSSSWPVYQPAEPAYTLKFDSNGGTGTAPAAQTLKYYESNLTLVENPFSRTGYKFLGWSVKRTPDNKWFCYTDSNGSWAWLTESQMKDRGLTARIYEPGYSTQFSWPWIKDSGNLSSTLTFYAQWEKTSDSTPGMDDDWHVGDDFGKTDCRTGHQWNGGVLNDAESILYTCEVCGRNFLSILDGSFRLAGANRFETAFSVAMETKNYVDGWIDAETEKIFHYDTVIIASGTNFADALSGSYLANVKYAPILLSYNEEYNNLVKRYIRENLVPGGTVYILGGEAAVPASMEKGLEDYEVIRLAGANRFETNLAILMEAGVGKKEILVCTGTNFADSLSASATGLPILLVYNESGKLTLEQKQYLSFLQGNHFTVIGGESAVSAKLEQALKTYGSTGRLSGANRFETSVKIAESYFGNPGSAVLAYAWNYPDGLCGGPLAYNMGVPLILTMDGYEAQARNYITRQGITCGVILGGVTLISDATIRNIFGLDADRNIPVK